MSTTPLPQPQTAQPSQPLNPLVEKIRAKFPGAYDDMDDATLTKSVLAKYPGYADLAAPSPLSSVAKPNVQMQQMDLSGGPVRNAPTAGLLGSSPNPVAATPGYTAAVGLPLAAAATAMAPVVAPGLVAGAKTAVKAIPTIAAMEGIGWLRKNAPLGKYIPPGAEWLPMFMGGKGAAEEEGAAASKATKAAESTGKYRMRPGDVAPERIYPKALLAESSAPKPQNIQDAQFEDVYTANRGLLPPGAYQQPSSTLPPTTKALPPAGPTAPVNTVQPSLTNLGPEDVAVNPRVLAGGKGIITTPRPTRGLLPGESQAEAPRPPLNAENIPRTMSGESAASHILSGFDNQTLLKIAKSRGISVTAEQQLKPTVGNAKIISKILDDMKPEELDEIRARYIESTRQPLPSGIGPEAYRTAAQSTYFPDLKVSKAKLGRMQKALKSRNVEGGR